MDNMSKQEIFLNFGFTRNPFKSANLETGDMMRIRKNVSMAIKDNAMISIVGERGIGKTWAVSDALRKMNCKLVVIDSPDQSRLLITDIERALIMEISDEKPKRGRMERLSQLRRTIGEESRKRNIVVILEEAHRLHGMTLRAIKTLRRLNWMGKDDLFTVILLSQSDPMKKPGVAEVRLRSDVLRMQGITKKEASGYITETVGDIITLDAITEIVNLPESGNYLDLQDVLITQMGVAVSSGKERVEAADLAERFRNKIKPDAKPKRVNREKTIKQGNNVLESVLNRRSDTKNQTVEDIRKVA